MCATFNCINIINKGEVHLSKHGLYPKTSGHINQKALGNQNNNELEQILWLLFLCDGSQNLLEISKKQSFNIIELYKVAEKLRKNITVDWNVKESVRAKLRLIIKNILKRIECILCDIKRRTSFFHLNS